jgi:subtilase family serine protease
MYIRFSFVLLLLAMFSVSVVAQQAVGQISPLRMSRPKAVDRATVLGDMDGEAKLHISVALRFGDPVGIQSFVNSVASPSSPNYRKFLTPEQVGQSFGLPLESVGKVPEYLISQGMTIRKVSKNRLSILADSTVSQAEAAFHTKLARFSSADIGLAAGHTLFSFTTTPSVPADLAPMIVSVGGLENFNRPSRHDFVGPTQLRTLYGGAKGYGAGFQGKGRVVGISSYDGFDLGNVPLEYRQFGLPTPSGGLGSNVSVITVDTNQGGEGGPQLGEGDVDIQCVLGMAPLCTLRVYDGGNLSEGFYDPIGTLTDQSDDNACDVITSSYGWGGSSDFYAAMHQFYLSMNAQGITNMSAAGDHGAPGVSQTPYPDIDPEVLIVGGTTITVDSLGDRLAETAWNLTDELGDGNLWGGAGGWFPSSDPFNILPPYQKGAGIPTDIPYRLTPDVALASDFSYEIFINGQFQPSLGYAFGGTSCASPTFAGLLANVEEQLISVGDLLPYTSGKQRFGRIQDLLYTQNGNSNVIYDVTSGQIGDLPNGQLGTAGPGWDFATGLGAVEFDGLYSLVANVPKVKTLTVTPTSVEGGGGTTITGTLTLSEYVGTPNFKVKLSSSNSAAEIPASVAIPLGAATGTFSITTTSVAQQQNVTITATIGTASTTASLTLTPPHAKAVSLSPSTTVGSVAVTGTVTIPEAAPTGGLPISLSSANTAIAQTPASVTIAQGKTSATFNVTTSAVSVSSIVKITATAGGQSAYANLTVTPIAVASLTLSGSSLYAGGKVTGTVTLNAAAPSAGAAVGISLSNTSLAWLSASEVTIAKGSKQGTFSLRASGVNTASSETVTATLGGVSKTAVVTIDPSYLLSIASSASTLLGGVNTATITLTLNAPAGPAGTIVKLSTSPAAAAAFSATTFTIAAGATTGTVKLTSYAVSQNTSVTVTGTAVQTQSTKITVTAALLASFTVSPTTIVGNGVNKATAVVKLNAPNGSTARTVALTSSSSAAGLPSSVSVPAKASSVSFTFIPKTVTVATKATLTATLGSASLSQSLTIQP